jgi:hypothetical protein
MRLFTLWSFAPVSYIERLCLKSMLESGHRVDFYTYDRGVNVPDGVTVRDASEIMRRDEVFFHRDGSPSVFSDLFRYKGLRCNSGTWVDMDMLLLRSIADMGDHIFGLADNFVINGAVLRLPADCPFFAYIDKLMVDPVPIPEHWKMRRKLLQRARAVFGRARPIAHMERGVVGPGALTHYLYKSGLAKLAQPVEVFYPVHWRETEVLFTPGADVEGRFTDKTRAVHLWNARLGSYKKQPPPKGSFIARMCERFGV